MKDTNKIKTSFYDDVYPPLPVKAIVKRDNILQRLRDLDYYLLAIREEQRIANEAGDKKVFYAKNTLLRDGYALKNSVIKKLENVNILTPARLLNQKHENGKTFNLTILEDEDKKFSFVIPSRVEDMVLLKDNVSELDGVTKLDSSIEPPKETFNAVKKHLYRFVKKDRTSLNKRSKFNKMNVEE